MSTSIQLGIGDYPDEAFMFYGLTRNKINTDDYDFSVEEINFEDSLRTLKSSPFDLCTLPLRTYAEVNEDFQLLASGARFGKGRGPVLASRESLGHEEIVDGTIAVPGTRSTATLLLQLYAEPSINIKTIPHDQILERVESGDFTAGIVIDESFVTMSDCDLTVTLDFGEWWEEQTGLPVPLSGCVINGERTDGETLSGIIRDTVQYGLDHPDEALAVASHKDPGRDPEQLKQFVHQYVTSLSCDMGSQGRRSIQTLLNEAYERGILSDPVNPVFIQPG